MPHAHANHIKAMVWRLVRYLLRGKAVCRDLERVRHAQIENLYSESAQRTVSIAESRAEGILMLLSGSLLAEG